MLVDIHGVFFALTGNIPVARRGQYLTVEIYDGDTSVLGFERLLARCQDYPVLDDWKRDCPQFLFVVSRVFVSQSLGLQEPYSPPPGIME